jgi:hypothetical protein
MIFDQSWFAAAIHAKVFTLHPQNLPHNITQQLPFNTRLQLTDSDTAAGGAPECYACYARAPSAFLVHHQPEGGDPSHVHQ